MEKIKNTITRRYKGTESSANSAFRKDAEKMAIKGYKPISEIYEQGRWTQSQFFLALFFCLFIIGIFALLQMLLTKPKGALFVTYKLIEKPDTKACPQCAETIKYAAKVCRFCGYRYD